MNGGTSYPVTLSKQKILKSIFTTVSIQAKLWETMFFLLNIFAILGVYCSLWQHSCWVVTYYKWRCLCSDIILSKYLDSMMHLTNKCWKGIVQNTDKDTEVKRQTLYMSLQSTCYICEIEVYICSVALFVFSLPVFVNTFSLSLLAALRWSDCGASGATTVLTGCSSSKERRNSSVWVRL